MWDIATGRELKKLEGHTGVVNAVAISADGQHIVSDATDKTVRVWDMLCSDGASDSPCNMSGEWSVRVLGRCDRGFSVQRACGHLCANSSSVDSQFFTGMKRHVK